jgi:hypothetical protein
MDYGVSELIDIREGRKLIAPPPRISGQMLRVLNLIKRERCPRINPGPHNQKKSSFRW